jgi:DNA-binding MarR family transcriptional regulator
MADEARPPEGIGRCSCFWLRRTARRVTQLYDQALAPAALTITQFGILAYLVDRAAGEPGVAIGTVAARFDMDPTTLTRTLKPLAGAALITSTADTRDRRLRRLAITEAGRARFQAALPLWRAAQESVETALGAEDARAMRSMLADVGARLGAPAPAD